MQVVHTAADGTETVFESDFPIEVGMKVYPSGCVNPLRFSHSAFVVKEGRLFQVIHESTPYNMAAFKW